MLIILIKITFTHKIIKIDVEKRRERVEGIINFAKA